MNNLINYDEIDSQFDAVKIPSGLLVYKSNNLGGIKAFGYRHTPWIGKKGVVAIPESKKPEVKSQLIDILGNHEISFLDTEFRNGDLKGRLHEYPMQPTDPLMDFEFTKQFSPSRRGSCILSVDRHRDETGRVIVYMNQEMEGNEVVNTPLGWDRKSIYGIIIAGYLVKPTGIFAPLKENKVSSIPRGEREAVQEELLPWTKGKFEYISFWD